MLGSMLLERETIGLVLQLIPRDEASRFYRPDHRLLFETLIDLYDRGKPIDLVVLEDELRRRDILVEVGGREYLIELATSVGSSVNAEHYARIVRDKALLRDLIQCSGEILQSAYDHREDAAEVLDAAEKRLFGVTEQRITSQPLQIGEYLRETFRLIETRDVEGHLNGVPTGFTALDDLLGGMQYGDFLVVAARPSMGKTALALSMLDAIGVSENIPAVLFSLEMSKIQITQRMLCSRAGVDMQGLRTGRLSERDIQELLRACGEMEKSPVFIDDTPGMSIMELRAKARRLKMREDIRVVFVDYMQLMVDRVAGRENRQQEIASISRGLKALGRELDIPIVALAQLNRQVEARTTNRPRMSDLRESGAIEQDADVVILLHREEYYWDKKRQTEHSADYEKVRGRAELIIDKQRNGPTGVVQLHFNPTYARFDVLERRYIDAGGIDADDPFDHGAPPPRPGRHASGALLHDDTDDSAPF